MSRTKSWIVALVLIAAGILLANCVFWVRTGEQVVITQRGEPRGGAVTEPGPHLKIPFVQKAHHFNPPVATPSYENSLVLTPLYVDYLSDSDEKFREEAIELKRRIGSAPHLMLGFATVLNISLPDTAYTIADIDKVVQRAKANGVVAHISIVSGFFHGWNGLREEAIRNDVRNAQWYADGLIAPAADLSDPSAIPHSIWITPSRYALPLRTTIEEGVRAVGAHLAQNMARSAATLVTISGDAEVEYSYARSFSAGAEKADDPNDIVYTDYSPFMIAEFRDWLKRDYSGDKSPATDDNGDGRTLDRDYGTDFETWDLKYYDHSGPVPFADYLRLADKLPKSGPNFIAHGFDAPRKPNADDLFSKVWLRFREEVLTNWVRDFAGWITTSPDPASGFTIPAARYYTHQIPAEFLFGHPDNLRLKTSASFLKTAFIDPAGSSGITAFNTFNGKGYSKTTVPSLYSALFHSAEDWGVLEYNPSVPSSEDDNYYLSELRQLYDYRPHLIVPFAWTDSPDMKRHSIKGASFERSLRRFVAEVGNTPWFSLRSISR